MEFMKLSIPDVILVVPKVFEDSRGFFYESFNSREFMRATGLDPNFVQDNHSKSDYGILRGLHYQLNPKAQGKLVRAVQGRVFDVAVDLRRDSPTFGQWIGETLSCENKKQLWIPPGFAHGFLTLSITAECVYKTTEYYDSNLERCIAWDDPKIGIQWPLREPPNMSPRDKMGKDIESAEVYV